MLATLALSLLSVDPLRAGEVAATGAPADTAWHVSVLGYLWASGVEGKAQTLPPLPPADVDLSFGDSVKALRDLDGGLITTVFARRDRLLLLLDLNWIKLSPSQNLSLSGEVVTLETTSESLTLMPMIGYRLHQDGRTVIDVYGGAKLWRMENSASVAPAVVTPSSAERKETWVDGVVGGQYRLNISDRSYVNAIGFAGAGGSEPYLDLYGGFGYEITGKWEAYLGYRVMQVDRESDQFLYDVTQKGPLVGVAARF